MAYPKELIKQIKKIDISTGILVEGLQSGLHMSIFKGQGIEFTDIREYVPGDDIRAIDWNVTARMNHPYIKEFTEERDQTYYFVFDKSGSGMFGSNISKEQKMLEVAASLMFAALRNNDKIGLCIFTNSVECFIPARRGRKHLIMLLNALISHQPASKQTNIGETLRYLSKIVKRRSSFFIISDFYDDSFYASLKIMKKHHEVTAVRVTDPHEEELPDVGLIELEDTETGEQLLIDTSDEELRAKYLKIKEDADRELVSTFAKCRAQIVDLTTEMPYDIPLKQFFAGKTGRRA